MITFSSFKTNADYLYLSQLQWSVNTSLVTSSVRPIQYTLNKCLLNEYRVGSKEETGLKEKVSRSGVGEIPRAIYVF